MKVKKILTMIMALLMVLTTMSCLVTVSADEKADKFAPTNEELIQMYSGDRSDTALGGYDQGKSFGAKVSVPEGKRMTQINFPTLATYNNNINYIVFRVYRWDTDYNTTIQGEILAEASKRNHADNDPLDVIFSTNRNLTGDLLWTATYVSGESKMTPWKSGGPVGIAEYYALGKECDPFCFSMTVADELTTLPAAYKATFKADGAEVATVTFYEGDTVIYSVPECPPKEGFYADWDSYTLGNEDIVINAVYTDASGAVKDAIPDATNVTAFAEKHGAYLKGEGCMSQINRDGTASFIGAWSIDGDIDAYVNIDYCTLMMKYYEGFGSRSDIPNKSHKYNVVAFKVKAPAVCLDDHPSLTVTVGRNTEIYGVELANDVKCDGTEEYWIFDLSNEPAFTTDFINTMKLNWAYSVGEESNLDAEFVLMGFQFFDTLEDALRVTGGEVATEAPTEEPTEAPTEQPTEAPTEAPTAQPNENATQAPAPEKKGGCGAVMGSAAMVMAAVAAAVVLKKKD